MNNANPATFPGIEPCSTNATMWLRRNGKNSEVEKERIYNEGQEEIMKAYELQWGAFTRADLERCRLKKRFHKSQHSSRMERKKTKNLSSVHRQHPSHKFLRTSDSACACEQHGFDTDKTHLDPLSLKCCLFLLTEELNYDFNTQKLDAPKLFFGTKTLKG